MVDVWLIFGVSDCGVNQSGMEDPLVRPPVAVSLGHLENGSEVLVHNLNCLVDQARPYPSTRRASLLSRV